MLEFYTWLSYLLPIVGLILIGIVTVIKNAQQKINILFFSLAMVIAVWLLALMIGDIALDPVISLWAVRAATCVGTLIAPLVLYFANVFPAQLHTPTWKLHVFAIVPSVFFMIVSLTPYLIPGIDVQAHSAQPTQLGLLYTLQSAYLVASFLTGLVIMVRKRKYVNARERGQIKFVMLGLIAALVVNVVTGVFLTILNQSNNFSNLAGALSFVIFVGTASYAIVKFRLFDIRLAVTRLIGYVITIGIIAGLYSAFVLLLSTAITPGSGVGRSQLITFLLPTIIVGLTFHSIEQFVAKRTQRIFYRDAYTVRAILDELSDVLISENDIDRIMRRSLDVLQKPLRPSRAHLALFNASGALYHDYNIGGDRPTELAALTSELPKDGQIIFERNEQPDANIAKVMAKDDLEVIVRLGTKKNVTGLLLLGTKKNGLMYNKQDIELLRISAKNLDVGLDNAKKYEQILHFADTLHSEVRRATAKLRAANKELQTLDALKDDFIATASHQLRTPAASVHDAIRMLNHPQMEETDRKELINLAEASSEHLITVVHTMLNMARLQAGHFLIEKSDTELIELTDRVIDQMKVVAGQRGSTIVFNKPDHPVHAQTDSAKINEILSNYIDNAIKYSPEHSTITVTLSEADGKVMMEVADQGMGVPEDERDKLFGKFYRASNARHEHPNGNGIGLYVVKSIAEGHGGEVYYKPGPNGSGSIFGCWIPLQ
ncbi:MAG TPA: ATP-binding protein [Candidatus Saccharimonadales bacterium]|nr:ATP-binding protein [Candidatus Saccharimonadales bacterium]